jgi:hypothetical protein
MGLEADDTSLAECGRRPRRIGSHVLHAERDLIMSMRSMTSFGGGALCALLMFSALQTGCAQEDPATPAPSPAPASVGAAAPAGEGDAGDADVRGRPFVHRVGRELHSRGRALGLVGASNYYLMYKSQTMVDNVLDTAAANGFNTMRMWGALDIGNQDGSNSVSDATDGRKEGV